MVELDNYNCSLQDRSLLVAMVHWSRETPLAILNNILDEVEENICVL